MTFLKLLLTGGLMFAAATALCTRTSTNEPLAKYCLPDYIKPISYDIRLMPGFRDNVFDAESYININVSRATRNISLHSVELTIREVLLINTNSTYLSKTYSVIDESHIITLHFIEEISPGLYLLHMKFSGLMTTNAGLFRTSYMNKEGDLRWLIATQFLPIGARRVFPCWDELQLTVKFQFTIAHYKSYTILSNVLKTQPYRDENGMRMTELSNHNSSVLPLYKIKVILMDINDFVNDQSISIDIWYRRQSLPYVMFATHVLSNITSYIHDKFANLSIQDRNMTNTIKYVIIPNYQYENMDNEKLIIFREDNILYDTVLDAVARKIEVIRTISCEMASQWLTSWFKLSSWSYMWIKTAFITYMGTLLADKIYPNLQTMNLFVVQMQRESLHFDDYELIEIIELEINSVADIEKIYSFSIYYKAPIIFRMLKYVLPHVADVTTQFFTIFENYEKNSGKVTNVDDFWAAMQASLNVLSQTHLYAESDFTLRSVLDIWTRNSRYPVLNVKRYTGRMVISLENLSDMRGDSTWWWPLFITYATQTNLTFSEEWIHNMSIWLTPNNPKLDVPLKDNNWIIVNVQQVGYYRVNYDYKNWQEIANYLNSNESSKIHVLNRAQIIDDAFHFMIMRQLNSSLFWKITKYLSQETDYIAWYPMFKALQYISRIFPFEIGGEAIKENVEKILNKSLENIGYEEKDEDDDLTKCLKLEIARWACVVGIRECLKEASSILERHRALSHVERKEFSEEWRQWIYCNSLRFANTSEQVENLIQFDKRFRTYLPCCTNVDVIIKLLGNLMQIIPDEQLYINILFSFITNHANSDKVLVYILENVAKLIPSKYTLIAFLSAINDKIYSFTPMAKLREFIRNWPRNGTAIHKKNYKGNEIVMRITEEEIFYILLKIDVRTYQIQKQKNYLETLFGIIL